MISQERTWSIDMTRVYWHFSMTLEMLSQNHLSSYTNPCLIKGKSIDIFNCAHSWPFESSSRNFFVESSTNFKNCDLAKIELNDPAEIISDQTIKLFKKIAMTDRRKVEFFNQMTTREFRAVARISVGFFL